MKKFDEARVKIDSKIKENGSQSITGKVLNEVLNAIVDSTEDVLETSEIETIPNKIDKEADDYYPKMAVGVADNLAGVDVVESEFTFRRSGGGAISDGVARIEAIKGNSVVEDGEVIHMNVQSLKSVGRNAWDEKWRVGAYVSTTGAYYGGSTNKLCNLNPIAVLSNTQYYVSNNIVNEVYFYDEKNNYISSEYIQYLKKFTTPAHARYVNFNTANLSVVEYNNDICINLFDSAFNGKYEPYIERSEDLSIVRKYFPDGMRSAGTAHDEIRYNKTSGKWEKVEAIGTRAYQDGDADNASYLTEGKVTCYPLAEPVVTELDAEDQFKDLDYQVWDGGTEKAISEGKSAPLAASITYGFNAVGLIKQLRTLVEAMQAKLADL